MTEDLKSVDALLRVAAARYMKAGLAIIEVRERVEKGDDRAYWQTMKALAEHMMIARESLCEANRLMLQYSELAGVPTEGVTLQ